MTEAVRWEPVAWEGRWYVTENRYAGGWFITVGAPWAPGHPERIVATVKANGGFQVVADHIVADHNAHVAITKQRGAQLSMLAATEEE